MFGRIKCPYCTKNIEEQEYIICDDESSVNIAFDDRDDAYLKVAVTDPQKPTHIVYNMRRIRNCPMCGKRLIGGGDFY